MSKADEKTEEKTETIFMVMEKLIVTQKEILEKVDDIVHKVNSLTRYIAMTGDDGR